MKEIEMITYMSEGKVRPYRFRLVAEDQSLLVVNIDRILFAEENKREGIIKYRCECIINENKRIIDIYFNKFQTKWYLNVKLA
jgi:hypothetical protein